MWFFGVVHFSVLTATEVLPYPRSVVTLAFANHTHPPTHSPLAFARPGCFGVVRVRLVASREPGGNSKNMDCAKIKKKLFFLFPPTPPAEEKKEVRKIFGFARDRRERTRRAKSERTIRVQATTRSARAISRHQDSIQNTFELCPINTAET